MRTLTTSFLALKNRQDGPGAWANVFELSINANTTAYVTSHPETLSYIGNTYRPIGMIVEEETTTADGSLPTLIVHVSNIGGDIYRMAKNNDLTMRSCTVRTVHTQSSSGDEIKIGMVVRSVIFQDQVGRFELALPINMDAEGPQRIYNRRDFPGIPVAYRNFGVL